MPISRGFGEFVNFYADIFRLFRLIRLFLFFFQIGFDKRQHKLNRIHALSFTPSSLTFR